MRFLLVTHIYPPAVDGGSKVIAKLGQFFESRHHQIAVFTSDCYSSDEFVKRGLSSNKFIANPNVLRLPVYRFLRRPIKFLRIAFGFRFLSVFEKGPIFKLIPFVKSVIHVLRFKPDYIISGPLPTTVTLYAQILKVITGAKLLINASYHFTDDDFKNQLLTGVLQSTDWIWTLTDYETERMNHDLLVPRNRLINVGNGVDVDFIKNRPQNNADSPTFNVLFIGSFASHKGIETLIDAFCLIKNKNKTLTLAGQPTLYSPKIELKIKNLSKELRSKIRISYSFESSKLKSIIDKSSVLVLPSEQESFGLVIIEAWARGVPVIGADIPSSLELINKSKGGLIFKTNSPESLKDQLNYMQTHSKEARLMAMSGYSYVKNHYTWDKIGEAIWRRISS
jgi:glycosyltransferase involved in cell wall biosynthesis